MNDQLQPAQQNTVLQGGLLATESVEPWQDFYLLKLSAPSPAETQICRSLTSQDGQDGNLMSVLRKMQTGGDDNPQHPFSGFADCLLGWRVICRALRSAGEGPKVKQDTRHQRLVAKMLLRNIELLCSSTNGILAAFDNACKSLSSGKRQQVATEALQHMVILCALVADALCVFLKLLLETRRETPIRPMARILRCLHGFHTAASEVVHSDIGALYLAVGASLRRVWQASAVVIERVVAAVPVECVDDDTARVLIPHAYRVPRVSPDRQARRPSSDNAMRQLLAPHIGKPFTFNKQYLHSMMAETGPVCLSLLECVFIVCCFPCVAWHLVPWIFLCIVWPVVRCVCLLLIIVSTSVFASHSCGFSGMTPFSVCFAAFSSYIYTFWIRVDGCIICINAPVCLLNMEKTIPAFQSMSIHVLLLTLLSSDSRTPLVSCIFLSSHIRLFVGLINTVISATYHASSLLFLCLSLAIACVCDSCIWFICSSIYAMLCASAMLDNTLWRAPHHTQTTDSSYWYYNNWMIL